MQSTPLLSKIFGRQHRHDKIMQILADTHPGGKVLDLGAREGIISKKMRDAGFEVTAADAVMAVPADYGLQRVAADFNGTLPFRSACFDVVTTFNTIEELESPFTFIGECARVLRPGGFLLLGSPNVLNLQARVATCFTGFHRFNGRPANEVTTGKWGGQRMNFQDYFRLRYNMHRNGFRITAVSSHHFSNKAMLLAPLYLPVALFTSLAMAKEKNPLQRQCNAQIYRHLTSADLMFGRHVFILAEKIAANR